MRLGQLESVWEHLQTIYVDLESREALDDARRTYTHCRATLQQHTFELKNTATGSPLPQSGFNMRLDQLESVWEHLQTLYADLESELDVDGHETDIHLLNKIGIFDGDFTQWYGFRDRFIANVHSNDEICDAKKLFILTTAVAEQAARVLGKWESTDANYTLAWKKLCSVYDNQYQIARAHIRSLQTMPRLEPATFDGIFDMIDTVVYARSQLLTMGVPADAWDLIIIYLMEERLDSGCRSGWIEYCENNKIVFPELEELVEFLRRRAVTLSVALSPRPQVDPSPERNGCHETGSHVNRTERATQNSLRIRLREKPQPIGRKRRGRPIGTGVNRRNVGDCIICKTMKGNRFVNCTKCSVRGHLYCLQHLIDSENNEPDWKCPKCFECAECHANYEMGVLYKCTGCGRRYHLDCLEDMPTPESINMQEFMCDACTNTPTGG